MIQKEMGGSDFVNFTVDNTWSSTLPEDDITSVSISYVSKTGEPTCATFDSFPDKFETSGVLQALCEEGLTTVVINIHSDGINYQADEITGNMCRLPEDIGTCAYEMVLPCDSTLMCETDSPTVAPTISQEVADERSFFATPEPPAEECPYSDAEFIDIDGTTMYSEIPITINFQNTSHVGFTVENTFGGTISSVYTQYQSGSFGQSECLEEQNVDGPVSIDFVAQCIRHTKLAIVNVWMSDCSSTETILDTSDAALVPECCYPGDVCKTVQYTFKLPCEPEPCPEDEQLTRDPRSRILAKLEQVHNEVLNPVEAPIVKEYLEVAPALIPQSNYNLNLHKETPSNRRLKTANVPSIRDQRSRHPDPFDESEDHFCVIEDYPCGESGDKVHACHYSKKDGYKTVCITEEESDAIRFFPKDYCGPCVGGFASA